MLESRKERFDEDSCEASWLATVCLPLTSAHLFRLGHIPASAGLYH
jgi:hypothetical protein